MRPPLMQTLMERDETLAQAEQTTRHHEDALEERKRQTQELVAHAALQEAQQVSILTAGGQ